MTNEQGRGRIVNFLAVEDLTPQKLHDIAIDYALEVLSRKSLEPTWFLSNGRNIAVLETPFFGPDHKRFVVRQMGLELVPKLQTTMITLVVEAYVWAGRKEDETYEAEQRIVSEQGMEALPSDRYDEVMMTNTFVRGQRKTQFSRFLLTPRAHGPALVGPRVDEDFLNLKSAMNPFRHEPKKPRKQRSNG
jgi:hypothetical protein